MKTFICGNSVMPGLLFGLAITLFFSSPLMALPPANCSQANITLSTQAEVDAFQTNYGGGGTCDTVTGNLLIWGSDIVNLNMLSALTRVGGGLTIWQNQTLANVDGLSAVTGVGSLRIYRNPALTNLDGLSVLASVGSRLSIDGNPALTNVDGLSALTNVGSIYIVDNTNLLNLDGLSALTSFGSSVQIGGNPLLTNVDFLSGLTSVLYWLDISGNAALTNLDGLSALTSVGDYLNINSNAALTNLDGLSALTNVGGILSISYNSALANVDGLSALTSVGGWLNIWNNPALANVDGLSALTSVGGPLSIVTNTILTNVDGLSALTSVGNYLQIVGNPALANLDGLAALTSVGSGVTIYNNDALANLDGLSALISVGDYVDLRENTSLASCSGLIPLLDNVDDGAPGPGPGAAGIPDVGGDVTLDGNLWGCNAVGQVLEYPYATIAVQKVFTDGNDETPVTLDLWCSSGSYTPASVTVYPDSSNPDSAVEHMFVITNLPSTVNGERCTVTETPVAGYTAYYDCLPDDSDSTADSSCVPLEPDVYPNNNSVCEWSDVFEGDANNCLIMNAPTPVKVEVTKVWEEFGAGGINFDRDATVTIACTAEIVSGDFNGKYWTISKDLDDSDGDYDDKDGKDVGLAVVAAKVIPAWYKTAVPPAKQQYTKCWAYESGLPSSVEVASDCGDTYETAGMQVSLGTGDSCTITNTQFFEGIPTLNQWGMAVMALLMLGVGMVGFRRFA